MIMIAILMLLSCVACAENSGRKVEPKYGFVETAEYLGESAPPISETIKEMGLTPEESSAEEKESINELAKEMVDFINEEYNLEWSYVDVETYRVDFASMEGYEIYNAVADPENSKFYISTTVAERISNEQLIYLAGHELEHIIRYANIGGFEFVLEDETSSMLGSYTSEAFTDLITIKFFESKGDEKVREFFYTNSSYCYTVTALTMLEYSMPDLEYYYLTDDMDAFRSGFESLAKQYIVTYNGLENEFEAFLYRTDLNMRLTQAIYYGYCDQSIANMWLECIYGNLERVFIMSQGCTTAEKEEVYDVCHEFFLCEGDTFSIQEQLDYFESCMN